MKTDPWFFRFFREMPRVFFQLIHQPGDVADEYTFESVELKDISRRLDGVFQPIKPGERVFFFEAQFYKDPKFYVGWFSKIFLYLERRADHSDWQALALFGSRNLDLNQGFGIDEWSRSGRIHAVYLDELPEYPDVSLEVAVLKLAVAKRRELLEKAKVLANQVHTVARADSKDSLLTMIEAFVVANFPKLTRQEIQTMLQLHDIRESAIFKEGKEAGKEEGKTEGLIDAIAKMLAKGVSEAEVMQLLEVDQTTVRLAMPRLEKPKAVKSRKSSNRKDR